MNKMVLIAVGVLVPFTALVVWGLVTLREPVAGAPVEEPEPAPAPAPLPPPRPVTVVAEPAPAPVVAVALPPEPTPAPAPAPAPPVESPPAANDGASASQAKRAVVNQLEATVASCFEGADRNRRLGVMRRPTPPARAMFSVNSDGTLSDIQVRTRDSDTALQTCVTDALSKARVDTSKGLPSGPIQHAFMRHGK